MLEPGGHPDQHRLAERGTDEADADRQAEDLAHRHGRLVEVVGSAVAIALRGEVRSERLRKGGRGAGGEGTELQEPASADGGVFRVRSSSLSLRCADVR